MSTFEQLKENMVNLLFISDINLSASSWNCINGNNFKIIPLLCVTHLF